MDLLKGQTATYLCFIVAYRPTKEDKYWVRQIVSGNNVTYCGSRYIPNTEIATVKILFNGVISTKVGNFMSIDLKDFYLYTPLSKH